MGTNLQVCPLNRVHSDSPLCYLPFINRFNFLVDCAERCWYGHEWGGLSLVEWWSRLQRMLLNCPQEMKTVDLALAHSCVRDWNIFGLIKKMILNLHIQAMGMNSLLTKSYSKKTCFLSMKALNELTRP